MIKKLCAVRSVLRLLLTCCLIFTSGVLISGCATKKDIYQQIDYTDEKIIALETERIFALRESDVLSALWQAKLLYDNTGAEQVYSAMQHEAVADFEKALSEKKYSDALVIYQSFDALYLLPLLEPFAVTYEGLLKERHEILFGKEEVLTEVSSGTKVSHMIRGTVTVWVDRGIKVESGRGYAERVIGSGFFIDERGYIITNYHVISSEVDPKYEGYSRLYIKMADDPDTRIPARVVGWDPVFDLALLKAEVTPPHVFPLGSSTDLEVGDVIYAIGSPIGLEQTITSGIVSAVNRRLFSLGGVLQLDAAVNQGNSGGPLIDKNGTVQAVIFAGVADFQGLNFAVPVEYVTVLLDDLYEGGKVRHGWFGAYGRTAKNPAVQANTALYEHKNGLGVDVHYVMNGGSAQRSGMKSGERITALNGQPIQSIEQLQDMMILYSPGGIARIESVLYPDTEDSQTVERFVYIAERPEYPGYDIYENDIPERAFIPIFGMGLTGLNSAAAKKYVITSILKASVADESGFSQQDMIEIHKTRITPEKDAIYLELYTKKRKSGFMDTFLGIGAPLDSPYYF